MLVRVLGAALADFEKLLQDQTRLWGARCKEIAYLATLLAVATQVGKRIVSRVEHQLGISLALQGSHADGGANRGAHHSSQHKGLPSGR